MSKFNGHIKTLVEKDIKRGSGHTVQSLRKDVSELLHIANKIRFETGGTDILGIDTSYLLPDFHINNRDGLSANFDWTHSGKTQLKSMYNQLARYINSDVSSSRYDELEEEKRNNALQGLNNNKSPEMEKDFTMADLNELINLKDSMPELFDGTDNVFYLDAIEKYSESDNDVSLLQIAYNEKKKLLQSGQGYTLNKLKKNILHAVEKGTYNGSRKKDRKAIRQRRKSKRKR